MEASFGNALQMYCNNVADRTIVKQNQGNWHLIEGRSGCLYRTSRTSRTGQTSRTTPASENTASAASDSSDSSDLSDLSDKGTPAKAPPSGTPAKAPQQRHPRPTLMVAPYSGQ